jgi:hypothetical protein
MTLQGIYQQLPRGIKPVLKRVYFFIKWFVNGARLPFLQFKNHVNVHLGCGDEKKKEFINIDIRTTVATDYTERIVHMKSVHRSLMDDGFCCYIGLPYFPNIARYYLDRRTPGIVGERFDLFNVYRYTHGDPEHAPTWWLAQLHKSLFDEDELSQLLRESGLVSHTIFVYCCIGEEGWYVSAGFFAKKGSHDLKTLQEDATRFLTDYAHNKVLLHTITFV